MSRAPPPSIAIDSGHGLSVDTLVAGIGARSFAFLIDWHVRVLLVLSWLLLCLAVAWLGERFNLGNYSRATIAWVVFAPAFAIYSLYHPLVEVLMQGSSPGKRKAGVRIVCQDGRAASATTHLLRNLFRFIDSLPVLYCVGVVSCLCTRLNLRIGDLAAGTVLVYVEHDGRELRRAIGRHAYAGGRDPELLRLTEDVLARWNELGDAKRCALAQSLLARFEVPAGGSDPQQLRERLLAVMATAGQQ